jgi:GT2 family glycosyltransferase
LVSVCIANYNGESLLRECLDSVFAQSLDGAFEVIVHDDASPDRSLELLRNEYPQVVLLESPANVGFSVSNNRMAAEARGEFLLLLNNDAALLPGALQRLVDTTSGPGAPAIATLPQYDWVTGNLVDRGCLLDPFCNPVPNLDPTRTSVAMTIGACLFLRRQLWNELGGFPAWMDSLAEDVYLCCQARLRGHRIGAAAGSGYRHRQGASFGGNRVQDGRLQTTYRRRALSERNKTAALVVLVPGPLAWLLLALHLFLLAAEGVAISALMRTLAPWRGIYGPTFHWTLSHLKMLLSLRRDQQSQRNTGLLRYFATTRWLPQKLRLLRRHGLPKLS